jgi:hypothetical protein
MRRVAAIQAGEIDFVCDEGLVNNDWFDVALANNMRAIDLEEPIFQQLIAMGLRRVVIPAGRFPHLTHDYTCIDYGGWPLNIGLLLVR